MVEGRGNDSADGAYKITKGAWGVAEQGDITIAWVEKYDQGFEVLVEGVYDARGGKIKAAFYSSRSVSGKFELALKPSIF